MFANIFLTLEVFIFVFCVLNIFKNAYNFVKVMYKKEGKIDNSDLSVILFGLSISYVITALIIGF